MDSLTITNEHAQTHKHALDFNWCCTRARSRTLFKFQSFCIRRRCRCGFCYYCCGRPLLLPFFTLYSKNVLSFHIRSSQIPLPPLLFLSSVFCFVLLCFWSDEKQFLFNHKMNLLDAHQKIMDWRVYVYWPFLLPKWSIWTYKSIDDDDDGDGDDDCAFC